MITVNVTYNRSDIPESLMVKGRKVDQQDLRMRLDKLIEKALEGAGMEWYASGTCLTRPGLTRDIAFDCDLEKILNAPTEQEINAKFVRFERGETEVIMVS